jgi:competence protein ComEC
MYRWIPYAFVRIAIFYCAGVIAGIRFPSSFDVITLTCVLVALIIVFAGCVLRRRGKTLFAGVVAAGALLIAGALNVTVSDESNDERHLTRTNGDVEAFQAVVENAPQDRPRTLKYEVRIDQVLIHGSWLPRYTRAVLYVRKDSLAQRYQHGDALFVRGAPQLIPEPQNPDAFDLRRFLNYKQVYYQAMVSPRQVSLLNPVATNRLSACPVTARLWADGVIGRHVHGEREHAIASAFVLGVTDGLDNELMNAYASTGAMHVLSVSGLHVGIVYGLILMMFKPFGARQTRWLLLGVSLIVLWAYAFVTGISASVLRAVVMFSFAAIARAWNHKINIYNILAATLCVLLVVDPFMIMSVGFQLSFVAVLGIVVIQPGLYRLWEPTGRLWDEIWKVCAVSIAAQIATLPLCLYYFHQFPIYFLLTNLFIIPGSFIVLVLGILLLVISATDAVAHFIGWLLEQLIDILNWLIFAVERLPGSVIGNIFITPTQCALLAALLVIIWVWTSARSHIALAGSLALFVIFGIISWQHGRENSSPVITCYAVQGTTSIDLIADHVTCHIGTSDDPNQARQWLPNRIALQAADRVETLHGQNLQPGFDLYVWHGLTIARVHKPLRTIPRHPDEDHHQPGNRADIVVISNNAVMDISAFSHFIVANCYVIDGSNDRATTVRLNEQAQQLPVRLHIVLRDGAFNLRL